MRTLVSQRERPVTRSQPVPRGSDGPSLGPAARSWLEESRGRGEPLPEAPRALFEARFGHSFADVRVHAGRESAGAVGSIGARALAFGDDLHFAPGAWAPSTREGLDLLGHELAHTVEQRRSGRLVQLKEDPKRFVYPWTGRIDRTWSAALRETPRKKKAAPHENTLADLPDGTEVLVVERKGGWLKVQVSLEGETLEGYVSQELVTYEKAYSPEPEKPAEPEEVVFGEDEFEPFVTKAPSEREAFLLLKRAETRKKGSAVFRPSEDELMELDLAATVLEATGKYVVERETWQVDFVQRGWKEIEVTTIEDFILFVETVERAYPSATPHEIASEIRQLWFSDVNWELLVDSPGIMLGDDQYVDIESSLNWVGMRFNMKTLAPASGSFQVQTRLGKVDIGHVMAGIDARLNGFPEEYPEDFLEDRGHDDGEAELKYETLKEASGGDSRDFTTWAGDLGQAYAEYLVDRYERGNTSATLAEFAADKAPEEEILGDIHGYIAVEVWKSVPASDSPSGDAFKVSSFLRELYLVDKRSSRTYQHFFEEVSEESAADLPDFIEERSLAFARPWFAKKLIEARGGTWCGAVCDWWGQEGWTAEGILEEAMAEFDRRHEENEDDAEDADKIGALVDGLMGELGGTVK